MLTKILSLRSNEDFRYRHLDGRKSSISDIRDDVLVSRRISIDSLGSTNSESPYKSDTSASGSCRSDDDNFLVWLSKNIQTFTEDDQKFFMRGVYNELCALMKILIDLYSKQNGYRDFFSEKVEGYIQDIQKQQTEDGIFSEMHKLCNDSESLFELLRTLYGGFHPNSIISTDLEERMVRKYIQSVHGPFQIDEDSPENSWSESSKSRSRSEMLKLWSKSEILKIVQKYKDEKSPPSPTPSDTFSPISPRTEDEEEKDSSSQDSDSAGSNETDVESPSNPVMQNHSEAESVTVQSQSEIDALSVIYEKGESTYASPATVSPVQSPSYDTIEEDSLRISEQPIPEEKSDIGVEDVEDDVQSVWSSDNDSISSESKAPSLIQKIVLGFLSVISGYIFFYLIYKALQYNSKRNKERQEKISENRRKRTRDFKPSPKLTQYSRHTREFLRDKHHPYIGYPSHLPLPTAYIENQLSAEEIYQLGHIRKLSLGSISPSFSDKVKSKYQDDAWKNYFATGEAPLPIDPYIPTVTA
ncbi:MAG: hypothetical protein HRT90_06985 [Candidatus Margulisbacteria bacterium]|nr:hypothetical protein [Candidatus Margulisiibacteriota bacterium]